MFSSPLAHFKAQLPVIPFALDRRKRRLQVIEADYIARQRGSLAL
jgi:hypothetical protein